MNEVDVFHANEFNSTFFTRCCEVAICDNQESCPGCGKKVIPTSRRWDEAYGQTRKTLLKHFEEHRKAQGLDQPSIVAARLLGKEYIPPRLCLMCGKPVDECYC